MGTTPPCFVATPLGVGPYPFRRPQGHCEGATYHQFGRNIFAFIMQGSQTEDQDVKISILKVHANTTAPW